MVCCLINVCSGGWGAFSVISVPDLREESGYIRGTGTLIAWVPSDMVVSNKSGTYLVGVQAINDQLKYGDLANAHNVGYLRGPVTERMLYEALIRKSGIPAVSKFSTLNRGGEYTYSACLSYGISTLSMYKYVYPIPGNQCVNITDPTTVCKIINSSLDIDHGTVSSDDVNGHRANVVFNISCNKSAVVKVRALATSLLTDEIILSSGNGGITSKLFVGNKSGITGETITVVGGAARVGEVYSELRSHSNGGIPAGQFSGQGVLIIDIQ